MQALLPEVRRNRSAAWTPAGIKPSGVIRSMMSHARSLREVALQQGFPRICDDAATVLVEIHVRMLVLERREQRLVHGHLILGERATRGRVREANMSRGGAKLTEPTNSVPAP